MSWWMWIVGGIVLLGIELVTPGSLFWIFFAIGAVVAGLAAAVFPDLPLAGLGILFSAVSLASLALFRKPLLERMNRQSPQSDTVDNLAGEVAIAVTDIAPGAVGKAELRGTAWSAINGTAATIAASQRCRVDRVDGLMLILRAESESR